MNGRLDCYHRYLKQILYALKDECGGFFSFNYSNVHLLNVAFSYDVTPNGIGSYSL